jgi:hypothetical protein
MAVKQMSSTKSPTKRAASRPAKASGAAKTAASNGGGRVRRVRMGRLDVEVHEALITDPKEREESFRRAASRIKTTAIIDTIHPGQEY